MEETGPGLDRGGDAVPIGTRPPIGKAILGTDVPRVVGKLKRTETEDSQIKALPLVQSDIWGGVKE